MYLIHKNLFLIQKILLCVGDLSMVFKINIENLIRDSLLENL